MASEKGEGAWKEAKASWLSESNKPNEMWSFWDKDFIDRVSKSDRVQGVMTMGTVVAIELKEEAQDGFGGTSPSSTDLNSRTLTRPRILGYASSLALDFLTSLRQGSPISGSSEESSTFAPFHMHSRPLGNVVYVMTSLWTDRQVVKGIEEAIEAKLASGW